MGAQDGDDGPHLARIHHEGALTIMRTVKLRRGTAAAVSLVVAAGGFAGAAATAHAAPASPALTVTSLHLYNHWVSEQSVFNSGNPTASRDSNGYVHLAGSLAGGTSPGAFTLPVADRPASTLYIDDYTFGYTTGFVVIYPNGKVFMEGATAMSYSSLAGISFPSASVGAFDLSLVNGWVSEDPAFSTGNPAVSLDPTGTVHLSGSLAGGSDLSTAFTLPAGMRPTHTTYLDVYTFGGTVGSLEITKSGSVTLFGGSVSNFTSLAGVSFQTAAAGAPSALPLSNGWKGGSFTGGPPAALLDSQGVVHLSGALNKGSDDTVAATLPSQDRPSHNLYLATYTFDGTPGSVEITTGGQIYPVGTPTTGTSSTATEYTSLGSISFPAGI